ncbi:MAG TPA: DNA topoisomerase IB [Patescibacteria group bacterium]|nr:DNA topoisomerase IB [Patescibacteria group bacterium]
MITEEDLINERLSYTPDTKPGFSRKKKGTKFEYFDTKGKKINDSNVVARIDSLVIPPAWNEVWISPYKSGHLQARGFDDKNRKQYIYHPEWVKLSQENKFAKMVDFALSLPKLRQKIAYEIKQKELDRERIIATIIWLLEHTFIRVGNEEYSKENNSFGLTTLRNRHAKVRGDNIHFDFVGKSGVKASIEFSNPTIAKTIKECIELPGYELFQYIDDEGNRQVVDSRDVNEYLREITQDEFTAKDFRTWGATNLSARNLYRLGDADDEELIKKNITETIKEVAHHLNNTVSVCRTYYIHPRVVDSYSKRSLIPVFDKYAKDKKERSGLSWNEYALVNLLKS